MAIFDKQKKREGSGPAAETPRAAIESPELYHQTVSMMANLLISNAAAMLGKVPHPDSGQIFRNLDAAELLIDLLQTLKEKCASKLPPEAVRQVGNAIADLQMLYVEEASVAGDFTKAAAMQKEADSSRAAEPLPPPSATPAPAQAPREASPAPSRPVASASVSAEASEPKEHGESKVKFTKKYD